MNARIAATAIALAASFAGSAFAETPTIVTEPFVSTLSRAQVQSDLAAYRQAGVNPWSTSYNPLRQFQGSKTREEVTAEFLAAREEVRALNGEDSGAMYLAQTRAPQLPVTTLAGQLAPAH